MRHNKNVPYHVAVTIPDYYLEEEVELLKPFAEFCKLTFPDSTELFKQFFIIYDSLTTQQQKDCDCYLWLTSFENNEKSTYTLIDIDYYRKSLADDRVKFFDMTKPELEAHGWYFDD